jgi:hypothetical protein
MLSRLCWSCTHGLNFRAWWRVVGQANLWESKAETFEEAPVDMSANLMALGVPPVR